MPFFQVGSEFPLITNLELVRRLNEVGKDSPGFVDTKFPSKEVDFLSKQICLSLVQSKSDLFLVAIMKCLSTS